MTTSNIDEKILKIFKDVLNINKITFESSMQNTSEWDSLKHIQLIIEIEEKFNITIDFSETLELTNVNAFKNIILKKLQ